MKKLVANTQNTLVYVDILNQSSEFFNVERNHWHILSAHEEKVKEFVRACHASELTIEIFIENDQLLEEDVE